MADQFSDLTELGWTSFFASQLTEDDLETLIPVKVVEVQRGKIRVKAPTVDALIPPYCTNSADDETTATVGDWILLNPETQLPVRLLQRSSLFKRRAPGTDRKIQLIAANIDTLFIVSSCNQDFNAARLERYLVLAAEAGVAPVLILTKADLAETPETYIAAAEKLLPGLKVETLDGRDAKSVACLAPWCQHGQTVAVVGSSGVGKSTLINTLTRDDQITTQAIREDDAKGRHTTTARTFYALPSGGWLLDTPGMRGLEVSDAQAGLDEVFSDIVALSQTCRFSDCGHETEPGCAVQAAISKGQLDAKRLKRWFKLAAEETYNTESLAERHTRDRAFGKRIKQALKNKRQNRGG